MTSSSTVFGTLIRPSLVLSIVLSSLLTHAQSKKIIPQWKKGDVRSVDITSKVGLWMQGTAFLDTEIDGTSTIEILAEDERGFIIEYKSEAGDMDWQSAMLDSLEGMEPFMVFMNGMVQAMTEEFSQMPVKYYVEKSGEAVGIEDFEQYYADFKLAMGRAMQNLSDLLNEQFEASEEFEFDQTEINEMLDTRKEEFRQTLLNQVNYLNQAYYEFEYAPNQRLSEQAIITEIDVLQYGTLAVNGRVVTEVLQDDAQEFRVRIETYYDHEDLREVLKTEGHEIEGQIRIVDRLEMSFDPNTNWISSVEELSHITLGELEMLNENSYLFK